MPLYPATVLPRTQHMQKIIQTVEQKCSSHTFEDSTDNVAKLRTVLQSWPSVIIQSRIEFDAICAMNLSTLSPLQLQRVSALKRDLIKILNGTK